MDKRYDDVIEFDRRQFASDNYSGICPEAWQALVEANSGHVASYGMDCWTRQAADALRELFECDCEVYFVFNGTAANSLALSSLCSSYHSILCHNASHIETDECGAPEFFSNGTKVLLVGGANGKASPKELEHCILRRSDIHYPKPKVISLTQATELGTVYTPDELSEFHELAMKYKLSIHMDGARFANALAFLNLPPKEITWKRGVDVLCFGGTKNGMALGEAVIFFNTELSKEFDYRCKQAGQLASKMRYLSAPWVGMLKDRAFLKYAQKSNQCAKLLESRLKKIDGIEILNTVQANSVFIRLSEEHARKLRERGWYFYTFIGTNGCRLMCSWDTTEEDVDHLASDIKAVLNN
ncbi:MAG: threonine aldolase [bacterium]|nr:threonine aldolase [bacterium]